MLLLRKATQHLSKEKFSWVPDIEKYKKELTDQDLYGIFNILASEQEYIESKIQMLD
jgi:hypothetical protein